MVVGMEIGRRDLPGTSMFWITDTGSFTTAEAQGKEEPVHDSVKLTALARCAG